ncbi:NAD(+) synthase [Spirochaeta cellobiosiphila]|uniref:NAD(+) synthase n=1 Tax=Spirochaeta cellobiosiphila TaxID=504483 RepID=UPI0004094E37|nr:NAD(+) synthase [Spirochaeta cellobiosiphila]
MKVALAQLDVKAGDPELNIQNMLNMIEEAKENNADIIAFPEMCIGGYFVGDSWLEDRWLLKLEKANEIMEKASSNITIIYGNIAVDWNKRGFDGRPVKYNAAHIVHNGHRQWEAKTLLPNYRIFDDKRYFTPRPEGERTLFDIKGQKGGVVICEDMWSNDYDTDPVIELLEAGADFIVNISASPWTYGKNSSRDKQIQILEKKVGKLAPFFYVNNVGVQNNGKNIITFDGDSSFYLNGKKQDQYLLEAYQEGIIYIDSEAPLEYKQSPTPTKIEQKYKAIIRGIQGLDELLGTWNPNFVIGLSGGADSSLVAALMVHALGSERIKGYNLPSRYNSNKTKSAAAELASHLGISCDTIPIEAMVEVNRQLLLTNTTELTPLVEENIQAKIRGTSLLSNLAAIHNGLMTNNGNKLEMALGYATLYGDVNGAIAPIGDLTKEEVFEMCHYINRDGIIIPTSLLPDDNYDFVIPPSAELKEDQRDPIKFGYHDLLIEKLMDYKKASPELIMTWYQEGKDSFCKHLQMNPKFYEMYKLGNPNIFVNDLTWFVRTMRTSIFKRIQAPPIILLSKTAFGYDLRESQFPWKETQEFRSLKNLIIGEI